MNPPQSPFRRRSAVTLLELLVVLAIIGTLVGLLLPAVQRIRDASARASCGSNLRQVGLALHAYHGLHRVLPPGVRRGSDPFPFLGWTARLLPFLEQQAAWEQARTDYARQQTFWGPPATHNGLGLVLPVYVCPADGRAQGRVEPEGFDAAFTHYLGITGRDLYRCDGVLYLGSRVSFRAVTDGTSHTLLVGERPPSPDHRLGWWYAGIGQYWDGSADMLLGVEDLRITFRYPTCREGPYQFGPGGSDDVCDNFHFWSRHIGGAQFLFVDGSSRFLSYSAHPVLPGLASRAGGEVVTLP